MNRADRRKLKKKSNIDSKFLNMDDETDQTNDLFCNRHNLLLENTAQPTDRDRRIIKTVTYKIVKLADEGKTKVYKVCLRCHKTMEVNTIDRPLLRE